MCATRLRQRAQLGCNREEARVCVCVCTVEGQGLAEWHETFVEEK